MARRYSSFMVRCWSSGSDDLRIEVEHIQLGERGKANSLTQAMQWIEERLGLSVNPAPLPQQDEETDLVIHDLDMWKDSRKGGK